MAHPAGKWAQGAGLVSFRESSVQQIRKGGCPEFGVWSLDFGVKERRWTETSGSDSCNPHGIFLERVFSWRVLWYTLLCRSMDLVPTSGRRKISFERLRELNAGRVASTCHYGPWELLYTEEHPTRSMAMQRERWFKSRQGRTMIARLLAGRVAE